MTDNGMHFNRESISDQARRAREELNNLSFAHDYGFDALKYVRDELGVNKFYEQVSLQRAQARVNGRIEMDASGNEHRLDKFDLAQLGLSAEAIAHVEKLAAANVASAQPAAEARKLVGGVEPLAGRVNESGTGQVRGH